MKDDQMSELKLSDCPKHIQPFLISLQKQVDELSSDLESKKQECYSRGERIEKLEMFLDRVLEIEHRRFGSVGVSGQFMYKTPESIFKQAKQLREGKK